MVKTMFQDAEQTLEMGQSHVPISRPSFANLYLAHENEPIDAEKLLKPVNPIRTKLSFWENRYLLKRQVMRNARRIK